MVAQQLMQSDLLQCLTQATITIIFFWSVKDIQGVPTGNKWVKLYNYIIFKSQQFLLHSAPDGRVVWWLGLVRWTIRMIETDLFQNLTSWAKGP